LQQLFVLDPDLIWQEDIPFIIYSISNYTIVSLGEGRMRLATFSSRDETHIGALISKNGSDLIFDFNRALSGLPTDMTQFLNSDAEILSWARNVLRNIDERFVQPLSSVTLMAPVPRPGKIICVGHNYHNHVGTVPPATPDIFAKFGNVVIGTNQPIIIPRASHAVDYEAELAVVIGKRVRDVPPINALAFVAGYTIFNDVTARDFQNSSSQWTLRKSFDTFGPMGPAIVTCDEIADPGSLVLSLWVNGEKRQSANTSELIFSVPSLLSYLSEIMTLEPGDLIATGTPSGTGASLKPPRFLEPGDKLRITIEKIGELNNSVQDDII
jgi:acylpyruvate hydrolase